MRRKHVIFFIVVMFLTWNMLMYYTLVNKSSLPENSGMVYVKRDDNEIAISTFKDMFHQFQDPARQERDHGDVKDRLDALQEEIKVQLKDNEKMLQDLRKLKEEIEKQKMGSVDVVTQVPNKRSEPNNTKTNKANLLVQSFKADNVVLPILMIACDRKDAVIRSLDLVLKHRPDEKRFPIIVSQDCGHKETADTIQKYVKDNKVTHIQQPDLSKIELPWPQRKFEGYYKIARHYKWALNQVFHKFNHSAVIVIEDDLEISPDFFEYFAATFRVLTVDDSLWCVSAWNDNGKEGMIENDPELLHRTDFFPGLGWMFERKLWLELGPKWPPTFWDDWMRHQDQRKNRSCIRPEVSRTSTFGKKGVSKGLFFDKHLKFIHLNDKFVPFTQKDLSYLIKDNYDPAFNHAIYSVEEVPLGDVLIKKRSDLKEIRVTYKTKDEFKNAAKKLGIMDDFKAGVERTAYRGVVSFTLNGQRVHLAPPQTWKGYDTSWT